MPNASDAAPCRSFKERKWYQCRNLKPQNFLPIWKERKMERDQSAKAENVLADHALAIHWLVSSRYYPVDTTQ